MLFSFHPQLEEINLLFYGLFLNLVRLKFKLELQIVMRVIQPSQQQINLLKVH